jgi:hypothetical protein
VYDPEIPVNIVDLGLVYSCVITPLEEGGEQGSYQDVHDGSRLRYGLVRYAALQRTGGICP